MPDRKGNSKADPKKPIRDLIQLIDDIPDNDEPSSVKSLIAALNSLLRIKVVVPPTIEIMSMIKHSKPTLYHATRKSITSTSNLNLLFQLDADPLLAERRIHDFMGDSP